MVAKTTSIRPEELAGKVDRENRETERQRVERRLLDALRSEGIDPHKPVEPASAPKADKHDRGKLPMSLVSPFAIASIAEVLRFGARKYEKRNWEKGLEYSRVYDSLQRHLSAWQMGQDYDEESGLSHLAHAGCCLMFLLHFEALRDDGPTALK